MNKELIRKLFFEATRICEEKAVNDAWLFEEEFTRLIVKECVNVVRDTFDDDTIATHIEEHFGYDYLR